MTQFQIPIKFKLLMKNDAEFKADLVKYLEEHKKLKPVRFGYTIEYAESLEYGTGPLSQFQPTVHGGSYSYKSIYDEIYNWAGKKDGKGSGLPIEDPTARAEFAKKITDRFFAYGMKPHPFWRPAINWLIENEQRMFDEGYSLYEIADEALRIANKCILDQNLPFSGKLQQSAIIEEYDLGKDKAKENKEYTDDEWNQRFKDVGWG